MPDAEFTRKKEAYLRSARLTDYHIIDSTHRYLARYSRQKTPNDRRRLFLAEYYRGPIPVPALDIAVSFEQLYAGTSVSRSIYPIRPGEEESAQITID